MLLYSLTLDDEYQGYIIRKKNLIHFVMNKNIYIWNNKYEEEILRKKIHINKI